MSSTSKRVPAVARLGAAVATSAVALTAALALAPQADASTVAAHRTTATAYAFTTLDNQADPTFNQLLGINSHDEIAGYFGAGTPGHPNKGYTIVPPYTSYTNENFPGSAQTQVTGLNNRSDTVGFWVTAKGTNRGFVEWNGVFASYTNPKTPKVTGAVNQLLGINNAGIAVGFYNDAKGHAHAYEVNQASSKFTAIKVPGATSSSFLYTPSHHLTAYQFPGGSDTQALGINDKDQIVGSYVDGAGVGHGFVLSKPLGPVSHLAEH